MKFVVSSIRTTAAVLGLATVLAAPAQATLITYTDLTAFNNNAGTTTLDTFDAWTGGFSVQNYSQSTKDLTLTTVNSSDNNGIRAVAQTGMTGKYLSWQGSGQAPEFTFTFKTAVSAFGFNWFNTDPTDNYQLVVNGKSLLAINFRGITNTGFFGVVGTNGETFKSLTLKTLNYGGIVDLAGIDNLRYGKANTAAVSAPATVAVLGLGLLALVSRRRSK